MSGEASSRPRRAAAAAGLLAALVAALYTHYYGVFLVLPIALAEAARLATAGRVNAFAAGSAAAALASAAGLLPLVRTAREFSAGFWRRPSWADLEVCYGNMLLNAALPVFFAAAVVFLARRRVPDPPPDTAPADRVGDWATVGYLVIPAAGLAVAMAGTGAFDKRYVVAGYLGAVGLFAGLTAGALRGDRRATGLVLAALAGWWLLGTELRYRKRCEEARQFEPTLARVRELAAAAPVYVTDPELFLTAAYACGDDRDRLVYPADPRAALEATGSDTDDRNLLKLATVLPGLTVRPFAECALPPGTVVIGTGWQVAAWGRAGHRFAPAGPVGPRSQAFRVLGPAGD